MGTFEDDEQRGGATEIFRVKRAPVEALCLGANSERPVKLEVEYASLRRAVMKSAFVKQSNLRSSALDFDAGGRANRKWLEALRDVQDRPNHPPTEWIFSADDEDDLCASAQKDKFPMLKVEDDSAL